MTIRELVLKSTVARKLILKNLPPRFKFFFGLFPVPLGKEKTRLQEVLRSGSWNMSYGPRPAHIQLEEDFSKYIGTNEAVAISGGGVGIQMVIRALGLGRQSEVLMQIDTCSAVPMAVMNSQTIPRFFDASQDTFLSSAKSVLDKVGENTQAVIASHLWGNSDDLMSLANLSSDREITLIEDCCLALGTETQGKKVGSLGRVGIFSFGSTKPIQAGEGGIIVTNDSNLAKELRAMRNWGERTKDFGIRDVTELSWNGRISEFSAAVAVEQLRRFPDKLEAIRENVRAFDQFLKTHVPEIQINIGNSIDISEPSFSQVVLRLNGYSEKRKNALMDHLAINKIQAFHANFEPVSTLSLFKSGTWTKWINTPEWDTQSEMSETSYPNAFNIYRKSGLGLSRTNFQSSYTTKRLISALKSFN